MATAFASRYRDALPQLTRTPFLTDGGIETTLIFLEGYDLPHFAAYDLLAREGGEDALRRYFEPYVRIALDRGVGIVLETPTWRANPTGRSVSGTRPISWPTSTAVPSRCSRRSVTSTRRTRRRSSSRAASARAATAMSSEIR